MRSSHTDHAGERSVLTGGPVSEKLGTMQRISILLTLLSLFASTLANGLEIETAYTRTYAADEIRTLSNHLGASLSEQGFRTVVASQPDQPGGQYFILHLEKMASGSPSTARMTLYTTVDKKSSVHSWDLPGNKLENWLYLGLTGRDWPGEDVQPLAWKSELLDSSGTILTEWKSFLWEMP